MLAGGMEARTPFDRAVACALAAGMGWLSIAGLFNGMSVKPQPGVGGLVKHLVIEEILFVLSAFFVCTFLYYLLGDRSWLRPHLKKYAMRAALVAFAVDLLIMSGLIAYVI